MDETVITRTVVVINPLGLHARPADLFVRTANQFSSQIFVAKDTEKVNGKSILELLMLAATKGTPLTISICGQDANEAMSALCGLFENGFGELEN